jgi:hypothetical protein
VADAPAIFFQNYPYLKEEVTRGFPLVLTFNGEAACLSCQNLLVSAAAKLSVASNTSAIPRGLCTARGRQWRWTGGDIEWSSIKVQNSFEARHTPAIETEWFSNTAAARCIPHASALGCTGIQMQQKLLGLPSAQAGHSVVSSEQPGRSSLKSMPCR